MLTCDYKGCEENAQWYRKRKGKLLKLCTKHEGEFARKHWGRHVDFSELNEDDINYLKWKEYRKELAKKEPFEVKEFPLKEGLKVSIKDKQTNERRSFTIKESDSVRFIETYIDLKKEGFSPKPSIDDYVKKLRNGILKKEEKKRKDRK